MIKNCLYCKRSFKSKYSAQRFCCETCANRFNLNGLKKVKLPQESNKLAEFVGIMLGDGNVTKYQARITLNTTADNEYISYVVSLMTKLFPGIEIFARNRVSEGYTTVGLTSRVIVDFLKRMGIISWKPVIPKWIYKNNTYITACIRGLIDTEGCISFKVYKGLKKTSVYRQLTFTSGNKVLLEFVRDGFNRLGFRCTQSLIKNIYLSNDGEVDKYRNEIGFSNPKLEYRSLVRDFNNYSKWRGAREV